MPKPVKPRSYNSPVRREQATRTRHRILEAAAGLFIGQGYGATSIRAIAEAAGVAPDTVYATFGSKAGLLSALIDFRLAPGGESSVLDRPESQAMRDERDPRRLLRLFARDYATMAERVRPVSEVLRTAKAVEPEMAAFRDEIEGYRFQYMQTVVGWLAKCAKLRMPQHRAAQVVWTLASPDVGRMLCDVQGWTTDEYAEWLEDTLTATLLSP
ncbi:MAG TPA: TetR/AcrR family transcriptional regulator [Longimicrobiales bacterium]|nr:TetR/AcrR family transcriptional regulator [Longimicrobiales bacterium]